MMKTLKFNKNSWHYKLAVFGVDDWRNIPDNLCGYFWCVIWGACCALWFFGTTILFAFCMLVEPCIYLYVALTSGVWVTIDAALLLGICFWLILAVIFICVCIRALIDNAKEKRRLIEYDAKFNGGPEVKDSFIIAMWRKFHDKTCAKIEFK